MSEKYTYAEVDELRQLLIKNMNLKHLIESRKVTANLLVRALSELAFSMIALCIASFLTLQFFPEIFYSQVLYLVLLLIGTTLGTVLGAMRAYNLFWGEKE